ncbi:hypothetical protein JTE90_004156 [Oedothorax gibbosus]|uniref:Uncharacterized protein n=1 Tax=Oedothorax gibbosus TaxID=931172 RepID=A0AAV6TUP3_9ARAC|nr:hypothetical protein JTE90_004156 [Oedothorax gibbosus]
MDFSGSLKRGRSRHFPNQTDDQKIAALTPLRQPRTVCLARLLATARFREPQDQGETSRTLPASPGAPLSDPQTDDN